MHQGSPTPRRACGVGNWGPLRCTVWCVCRMQELCSLHQRPVQLQPEQQAADRKLLEELQVPLIHAWQLDGGKGYRDGKQGLFDASLLRVCLKWGLNFSSPDGQGRTLLYSACMVRWWIWKHMHGVLRSLQWCSCLLLI